MSHLSDRILACISENFLPVTPATPVLDVFDSLHVVMVAETLEANFEIEIAVEEIATWTTVGDIVATVSQKVFAANGRAL